MLDYSSEDIIRGYDWLGGRENANKTSIRFGWCANGGFLEG